MCAMEIGLMSLLERIEISIETVSQDRRTEVLTGHVEEGNQPPLNLKGHGYMIRRRENKLFI